MGISWSRPVRSTRFILRRRRGPRCKMLGMKHRRARRFYEALERRRMLHASLELHVNFEPAGAAVPVGYFADTGAVFGDRGNGFTYGWDASAASAMRDRN